MQEYRYLLDIALILLMTKAFGLFSRRLRMPSVAVSYTHLTLPTNREV